MKRAFWQRALLAGLLTLGVAAPSVATFTAGHASADTVCVSHPGTGMRPTCWEW
jgi:hypothetical protein